MEEIEGMEAVGTGLAVVVEVNDDEFNVVGFGRETPAEASEEALDGGAPAGTVPAPAARDEISLHLASSVSGVEVFIAVR